MDLQTFKFRRFNFKLASKNRRDTGKSRDWLFCHCHFHYSIAHIEQEPETTFIIRHYWLASGHHLSLLCDTLPFLKTVWKNGGLQAFQEKRRFSNRRFFNMQLSSVFVSLAGTSGPFFCPVHRCLRRFSVFPVHKNATGTTALPVVLMAGPGNAGNRVMPAIM